MNEPGSAREALIAELLGDLAELLARAESITPVIEEARQALVIAAAELGANLEPLGSRMAALANHVQVKAVEHIAKRTLELRQESLEAQSAAMTKAAREIFGREVEQPLRRLVAALERSIDRVERPWQACFTHALTAVCAAGGSAVLVLWLLGRA